MFHWDNNIPIAPEAVQQFANFFPGTSQETTLLKNPTRSVRSLLKRSSPFPDFPDIFPEGTVLYPWRNGRWIFGISEEPHVVVRVVDFNEFIANRVVPDSENQLKSLKQRAIELAILGRQWDLYPKAKTQAPLPLESIEFTFKALKRVKRLFPFHSGNRAEKLARRIFLYSSEKNAISPEGLAHRLAKYNFVGARYFRLGKCRFVVRPDPCGTYLVLTVELDHCQTK